MNDQKIKVKGWAVSTMERLTLVTACGGFLQPSPAPGGFMPPHPTPPTFSWLGGNM